MNPLFNGKAGEVGKTGEEPREPEEGGREGEEHSESEGNRREDEDIVALIRDLENQGLVESFLNNMYSRLSGAPLVSKEPYITPKGRALIEYVTL